MYPHLTLKGGDTVLKKEAGLPNIQGTLSGICYWNDGSGGTGNGAIQTQTSGGKISALTKDGSCYYQVLFNAMNSNDLYGKSDTVQPASIQLIVQIKF